MTHMADSSHNIELSQMTLQEPVRGPILSGEWSNGAQWLFYVASSPPDGQCATAVFAVALVPEGIVLTVTARGVKELLGGHVEGGERIDEALCREALEEGGIAMEAWAQLGYREVYLEKEVINKSTGLPYPQRACIPYYVGFSTLPLTEPLGNEVVSREVLSLTDALRLDLSVFPEKRELILLLRHCLERAGEPCDIDLGTIEITKIHHALMSLSNIQRKK